MRTWLRITRREGDRQIDGVARPVFIHNRRYFLTELKIYADGVIDCWEQVTFDCFKRKVADGWVVTGFPAGADVSIHHLSSFKVGSESRSISPEALVAEVADIIETLNGRPSCFDKFREALTAYQQQKTPEAKEKLRVAYEAVPDYERVYLLGDQDAKDIPIRVLLYGEQEVEKWPHRAAAKQVGATPPSIDAERYLDQRFTEKNRPLNAGLKHALEQLYLRLLNDEPALERARQRLSAGELAPMAREAIERAQAAIDAAPRRLRRVMQLCSSLHVFGEALLDSGQEDEALATFERALQLDDGGSAAQGLARVALLRNDRVLARRALEAFRHNELYGQLATRPELLAKSGVFPGVDFVRLHELAREN